MANVKYYDIGTSSWKTLVIGKQGPTGPAGPTGPTGPTGPGVPVGGTTGQVLAKSSGTDYATQWVAPSGLEFIKSQAIGTAVSTVVVADAFSAAYENYRVIIAGGTTASAINDLYLQIGNAVTGYYGSRIQQSVAGTVTGQGQSNTTSLEITRYSVGTNNPSVIIDILGPFQAERTGIIASGIFMDTVNGTTRLSSGFLNNTTSYTGFTVLASAGTITGGSIQVYGYRKA
jgi:hypothetical protein